MVFQFPTLGGGVKVMLFGLNIYIFFLINSYSKKEKYILEILV